MKIIPLIENLSKQPAEWLSEELIINVITVLENVMSELSLPLKDGTVGIRISDDEEVQELNSQFRGKDKPTNVLSFPYDEGDEMGVGDIIISLETVIREASEQNKIVENHFKHMLIHSILHLNGYDHIKDDEAQKMENLEIKILHQLKISNPYG